MVILDHSQAQALLAAAELSADAVCFCAGRFDAFGHPYLTLLHHSEQHYHALKVRRDHTLTFLRAGLIGLSSETTGPLVLQPARFAASCDRSWTPAAGTTRPCGPSCVVKSPRSCPTPPALSCRTAPACLKTLGLLRGRPTTLWPTRQGRQLPDRLLSGPGRLHSPAPCSTSSVTTRRLAQNRQRRMPTHVPDDNTLQQSWRLALDPSDAARADLASN
jgi:hypothetical protein